MLIRKQDAQRRSPDDRIALTPPLAGEPERLVGLGFRCWLNGFRTGNIGCWELAWQEFSKALGASAARPVVTDLACFVRAVQGSAIRRIEVYPTDCPGFCRDECLAIAMVAACQHSVCPALKACAFALIGSQHLDTAIGSAESFASSLRQADQVLSATSICNAAAIVPGAGGRAS